MPTTSPHRALRVVLGVLLGIIVVVGGMLALHFTDIIRLPFLPTRAETAFGWALNNVAKDGDFTVEVDAELPTSVEVDAVFRKVPASLATTAHASGKVRGFDPNDPYTFKVVDGRFSLNTALAKAEDASSAAESPILLEMEANGTFEADLAAGELAYQLIQPLAIAGMLPIDTESLKNNEGGSQTKNMKAYSRRAAFAMVERIVPDHFTFGDSEKGLQIKDFKIDDSGATFTIDGKSLTESPAFKKAMRAIDPQGIDFSLALDDVDVIVRVDEAADTIRVSAASSADLSITVDLVEGAVVLLS